MSNQVLDTIMSRRSIRAYKPEQLTQEQLDWLVKAALISPTAMNTQAWHFTFLQNKELLDEMEQDVVNEIIKSGNQATIDRIKSRNNKVLYNAPTLVIITGESGKYTGIDAGIAVQSLALAAKSMGLESVILGMPGLAFAAKGDYWAEKLQLPKNHEFTISIAIGYGAMEGTAHELDMSKVNIIK